MSYNFTISKISSGLELAGAVSNGVMDDKELINTVIKVGPYVAGFAATIGTYFSMPNTTSFAQDAMVSLGVGWGTLASGMLASSATLIGAAGALFGMKAVAPKAFESLNAPKPKAAVRAFGLATAVACGLYGSYAGYSALSDGADDLISKRYEQPSIEQQYTP